MMLRRRFLEFFSGEVLITRAAQDRLASIAALEDMLGVPREDKAWKTRPWTAPCCKSHTRSFPLGCDNAAVGHTDKRDGYILCRKSPTHHCRTPSRAGRFGASTNRETTS